MVSMLSKYTNLTESIWRVIHYVFEYIYKVFDYYPNTFKMYSFIIQILLKTEVFYSWMRIHKAEYLFSNTLKSVQPHSAGSFSKTFICYISQHSLKSPH